MLLLDPHTDVVSRNAERRQVRTRFGATGGFRGTYSPILYYSAICNNEVSREVIQFVPRLTQFDPAERE